MKCTSRLLVLCAASFIFMASGARQASAFTLGVMAGESWAGKKVGADFKKPAFQLGGELAFGTILDFGIFYENTSYQSKEDASGVSIDSPSVFSGMLTRLNLGPLFVDVKLGLSWLEGSARSDKAFSYGYGLGYTMKLGRVLAFMPRLGYRSLPVKAAGSTDKLTSTDLGLIFALSL